jgi:hypothetical protein
MCQFQYSRIASQLKITEVLCLRFEFPKLLFWNVLEVTTLPRRDTYLLGPKQLLSLIEEGWTGLCSIILYIRKGTDMKSCREYIFGDLIF